MKKENIKIILTSIFSFIISALILSFVIPDVKNKSDMNEIKDKSEVKNKTFAVMLQGEDGYVASEESTWPTNGYTLNEELTNCIDNSGTKIENVLNYNDGQVSMKSNKNLFCYLYFDRDKDAPIVNATVNNNNSSNASLTITSNETGTYCVNTSSTITNMSNCVFSGNITKDESITTSVFSTGGDYYVHVKDGVGNIAISEIINITITQKIGEYLLNNPSTGLNVTSSNGGLYRYIGSTVNNYIKLNNILYRIIGITSQANVSLGIETGQLKLIKAETIGNYNWDSSATVAMISWEGSDMYTYLQSSSVLENSNVVPNEWYDKITSVKWNVGDVQTYTNGDTIYELESAGKTSVKSKIGLMYLSDYYYAYVLGGGTNCRSTNCVSWMTDTARSTWTMTRYGYVTNGGCHVWYISSSGQAIDSGAPNYTNSYAVRPVFYIDSNVIWKSGTGTSTDPFIVE